MLGEVRDEPEERVSSVPNRALEINPEPWGNGGAASLTGRAGFGDAALEEGAVAVVAVDPFSFLGALASALG